VNEYLRNGETLVRLTHLRGHTGFGMVVGANVADVRQPSLREASKFTTVGLRSSERRNREILAETLVWTAGTALNPIVTCLDLDRDKRGGIKVDRSLAVPGTAGVWALGDCAALTDAKSGKLCVNCGCSLAASPWLSKHYPSSDS